MFNWFGRRYKTPERYPTWADIPPIDNGLPEVTEYPSVPEVKAPKTMNDDGYTVGPGTGDYCTMLRVKSDYTTLTLQLNEAGCRQMIKLLESTLPEHDNEAPEQPQ